jgi:acetyl-CoA synthetase
MSDQSHTEGAVTNTNEWYHPTPSIIHNAYVPNYGEVYRQAASDLEAFWAECAAELDWFAPWEKVLDRSNAPFYKWFVGAKTNIAYNALDRHVKTWRKNKVALIWRASQATSTATAIGDCGRR